MKQTEETVFFAINKINNEHWLTFVLERQWNTGNKIFPYICAYLSLPDYLCEMVEIQEGAFYKIFPGFSENKQQIIEDIEKIRYKCCYPMNDGTIRNYRDLIYPKSFHQKLSFYEYLQEDEEHFNVFKYNKEVENYIDYKYNMLLSVSTNSPQSSGDMFYIDGFVLDKPNIIPKDKTGPIINPNYRLNNNHYKTKEEALEEANNYIKNIDNKIEFMLQKTFVKSLNNNVKSKLEKSFPYSIYRVKGKRYLFSYLCLGVSYVEEIKLKFENNFVKL